ncbi:hypothetical protein ILYODFUR_016220 [Ilyodon furcidens]|uniref:Uncharacterized protein n=1 Tax=Ilyodon furcidens TaxID=33524 RepID=A0ABV0UGK3_9TELE
MGGGTEESALNKQSFPVILKHPKSSANYSADFWRLCCSLHAPVGGGSAWAQPTSCLEQRKTEGLRLLCFSCVSNASPSEAMFLFKPLKELRAKRKGTHSCFVCVCVCMPFRSSLWHQKIFGYF